MRGIDGLVLNLDILSSDRVEMCRFSVLLFLMGYLYDLASLVACYGCSMP